MTPFRPHPASSSPRARRAALVLATLLPATALACHHAERPPSDPPFKVEGDVVALSAPARESASVRVEPVRSGDGAQVTLTGRLVWNEDTTVRVFPPVSGRVTRISADLGSPVRKGQLLALLASPDFGQAQADAARAATDLTATERNLVRMRLLQERGAAARKDFEQAEAEEERARAERERTAARLHQWDGGRTRSGRVDQEFPLVSPVGGLVVERNLNPGQEVRTDAATPLFVVSEPHRLWVLLDVTEKDLADLAVGSRLAVHAPAYPERTFAGTLDRLGAGLDPATRTVHARGLVANEGGLLKSEMYVTVDVADHHVGTQLLLPARAVIDDEGQRFVFVEQAAGRYRRTPVSVGRERDGFVPVVEGLPATSRIVTEGSLLLEAAWVGAR